ncbi:MAG: alpha/beta fold hydrolase [Betaproteobacteria bacterium]
MTTDSATLATAMTEGFFEVAPGKLLRYLTNGNTGKPQLVLLHGVNSRAEFFDEFLPFITEDYEIFAPDFRGHGESFRSEEPYSLACYAADIGSFIQARIAGPFALIGMSLGGRIGLLLAGKYGQWLKKLVVIDVGPDVDPAGLARITKAQALLPQSFESREALEAFYLKAYGAVSRHYIERIISNGWKQLPGSRWVTSYDRRIWQTGPETFTQDAEMLNAVVPQIDVPVLIIRGARSDILTAADAAAFVGRLAHGSLIEIPGATHGVLLEEPARCGAIINEFLQTAPASVAGAANQ